MKKSPWKLSAIALAAGLALGLYASDASALALGRVTVQSALGEPFRAEIDVPEINADEAANLQAVVGSAAAFRSAGMELSPTIASVQISLQRRADGRYFLRLTSDRAVNEPFLDLVLEASWGSGRVVRDYTMLFDPPNLRQGAPVATAQAPAAPRPAVVSTPVAPRQAPTVTAPQASTPRPPAAPRAEPATPAPVRTAAGEGQRVTVQGGETAGRIAMTHKAPSVSLDQMLVAMLRANPEAFVGGNVNRLRAGAVIDLPTAEQASATEPAEARQMLTAQSRDFNDFRRRLAEGAPTAAVAAADRQATGRVQAQVEEKTPTAGAADKLTLSKGALQGKSAAAVDAIARDRTAQDAAARVAELNKNIADLSRLSAGTAAGAPARPGATAAAAPGSGTGLAVAAAGLPGPGAASATAGPPVSGTSPAPTGTPALAPAAATADVVAPGAVPGLPGAATAVPGAAATAAVLPGSGAPADAPAAPDGAAVPPPADAVAAAPTPVKSAAPAPAPAGLFDDLLQNPLLVAASGGLLALLVGFGLVRARRRKAAQQVDSSFLESRAAPDSFFGASGGQRIDTAEGASASGSSMVYSASQLDAAGDVDPVAEADVYLAYGRDLQAEEILKEALRTTPERVAVHAKLLEIYAKRRELKAFNKAAEEAFGLTRGQGPEWEQICALGHGIDPANPLYLPGGPPAEAIRPEAPTAADGAPANQPATGSARAAGAAAASVLAVASAGSATAAAVTTPTPTPAGLDLDLDFDLRAASSSSDLGTSADAEAADTAPGAGQASQGADAEHSLDFELPEDAPASAPSAAGTAPNDAGMIDFDLSSLSLDLDRGSSYGKGDTDAAPSPASHPRGLGDDIAISAGLDLDAGEDPLVTKLALAEEFSAIGDPDGARSLAEEVRDEASGDLKGRAERFLAELN